MSEITAFLEELHKICKKYNVCLTDGFALLEDDASVWAEGVLATPTIIVADIYIRKNNKISLSKRLEIKDEA